MALIEEGGQWLENAYCTHLVPASGKSVLLKKVSKPLLTLN